MLNLFKEFPAMPDSQKIVFILSLAATAGVIVFLMLDWAKVMKHGDYFYIPCMGLEIILYGILSLMRKQKGSGIFSLILGSFILVVYAAYMLRLALIYSVVQK